MSPTRQPFSAELHTPGVELAGLLALLGEHLYSTPAVAVRELVQNAHDSIVRRRMADPAFAGGSIHLRTDPARRVLIIEDDGAGLTGEEIVADLATIGRGATRGVRDATGTEELIGLFGIGFLSAFVIAHTVTMTTTSWQQPDRGWRYRSTGGHRYSVEEVPPRAPGTLVELELTPDAASLADASLLRGVVARYTALLRLPVHVGDATEPVNADRPPWRDAGQEEQATQEHPVQARRRRIEFAARFEPMFEPLCTIDLAPAGGSDAAGLLWVQDGATYGSSDNRRVWLFCRGMLVDDDARDLLPRWAGFCGAVVESSAISPTASREDVRRDAAWEAVQAAVADRLIQGFTEIAAQQPAAWRRALTRHNEALLGAALTDDRLFALVAEHLTVPTTEGDLTVRELARLGGGAVHVSVAEHGGFEEMVCRAQGIPVAIGVRYGVLPFLRSWQQTSVTLVELGTAQGDRRLFRPTAVGPGVLERLSDQLGGPNETVVPAFFEPATLPLVPVRDRDAELKRRIEEDQADRRISSAALALARLHTAAMDAPQTRLYVNMANPVIRALAEGRAGVRADVVARLLRSLKMLVAGPGQVTWGAPDQAFAEVTAILDGLLAEG
jgi:molecular chaperone HtpG